MDTKQNPAPLAGGNRAKSLVERSSKFYRITPSDWIKEDRQWFQRHRRRIHRLRPVFEGELEELGFPPCVATYAVIRKLQSDIRVRLFCALPNGIGVSKAGQDELWCHALFDLLNNSISRQHGFSEALGYCEINVDCIEQHRQLLEKAQGIKQ